MDPRGLAHDDVKLGNVDSKGNPKGSQAYKDSRYTSQATNAGYTGSAGGSGSTPYPNPTPENLPTYWLYDTPGGYMPHTTGMHDSGYYTNFYTKAPERELFRHHPIASIQAFGYSRTASRVQNVLFGDVPDGTRGNAFRHAYWTALMTVGIGPDMAETYGTAHEYYAPGTDMNEPIRDPRHNEEYTLQQHVDMDLYNNAVGITVGQKFLGLSSGTRWDMLATMVSGDAVYTTYQDYGVGYDYELLLALMVLEELENGNLHYIVQYGA